MEKIKGLLTKDLLLLKSYKKNFVLSIIIYSLLILFNAKSTDMIYIGSSMIMFLFSTYAMATFNYDEKSKSDRYILTLPITKKEVILSKYILAIFSLIIGSIIGIILSIGLSYISIRKLPNLDYLFSAVLGTLVALSFMQSIQIPCIYKYGAEKGRLQIYIIMMFIVLLLGAGYMFLPQMDLSFIDKIDVFVPIILIIIILINYLVSYKVATKIYSKKEV